ncbi:hypothetical protein GCM10010336_53830 [Streptomyces goshikiensis]|nr:hypothetical protein GCM10010336_53830 [Streptomyces goshikiensis]
MEQRKKRFEYSFGTVVLGTAPAHLTDAEAARALLAHDLACSRYAAEGDPGPLNAYFAGADVAPGSPLPADQVGEGRRLAHNLRTARWEAGKLVLEVAPAHMPDRTSIGCATVSTRTTRMQCGTLSPACCGGLPWAGSVPPTGDSTELAQPHDFTARRASRGREGGQSGPNGVLDQRGVRWRYGQRRGSGDCLH